MRKFLKVFIILVAVCFVLIGGRLYWMAQDEPALDYSLMTVELGSSDPEVNGYVRMQTLSDERELVGMEDYYEWMDGARAEWNFEAMAEAVEGNREWMDAMRACFQLDEFRVHENSDLVAFIPSIGGVRDYVQLRTFEAMLSGVNDSFSSELDQLLVLSNEVEIYAKSSGSLIHLLTSDAIAGIVQRELYALLEADLSVEDCRQFLEFFTLPEIWTDAGINAFRQEFWFSVYCLNLTRKDPNEFLGESAYMQKLFAQQPFLNLNRTKNIFYQVNYEIIAQLPKPVSERRYPYGDSIVEWIETPGFSRFLGRNPVGMIICAIVMPATEKVVEATDRVEMYGEQLRLAFALKAYYSEHGNLPESLDVLVPDYISEIPMDRFDGQAMRYDPDAGILYSVGNDFEDWGGSELPFEFQNEDIYAEDFAEKDVSEPTLALRFLPWFQVADEDEPAAE